MNELTQLVRQMIDEDQSVLAVAASIPKGRRFLRKQLARAEYEADQGMGDGWARRYAERIKEALANAEAEA